VAWKSCVKKLAEFKTPETHVWAASSRNTQAFAKGLQLIGMNCSSGIRDLKQLGRRVLISGVDASNNASRRTEVCAGVVLHSLGVAPNWLVSDFEAAVLVQHDSPTAGEFCHSAVFSARPTKSAFS